MLPSELIPNPKAGDNPFINEGCNSMIIWATEWVIQRTRNGFLTSNISFQSPNDRSEPTWDSLWLPIYLYSRVVHTYVQQH